MNDPVYHLLCGECRTAIVADTFAKRERIPRWSSCPMCDACRGDTWRPIEGPAGTLAEVVGEYDTVEAALHKSGMTLLVDEYEDADYRVHCYACDADYVVDGGEEPDACRECDEDDIINVDELVADGGRPVKEPQPCGDFHPLPCGLDEACEVPVEHFDPSKDSEAAYESYAAVNEGEPDGE